MKIPRIPSRRCLVALAATAGFLLLAVGPVMASGGGGDAAPKGWVATDTYRVINFLVLAGGLFFLLRKPISSALNARIKGIQDQLDDLEAKKRAAEKELASYDEKLAEMDQEAERIVAQYIQQGEDAKVRILEEAEAAAVKLEEQAKRTIEHEFKQARAALQTEIIEEALARAEKLLEGGITADDQERLVEEYLQKVVA